MVLIKRILRYVKGTLSAGLHLGIGRVDQITAYNVSAIYMTVNPVHHGRTKHIEIDIHFVREKVGRFTSSTFLRLTNLQIS
jgi:hypothetical protein